MTLYELNSIFSYLKAVGDLTALNGILLLSDQFKISCLRIYINIPNHFIRVWSKKQFININPFNFMVNSLNLSLNVL